MPMAKRRSWNAFCRVSSRYLSVLLVRSAIGTSGRLSDRPTAPTCTEQDKSERNELMIRHEWHVLQVRWHSVRETIGSRWQPGSGELSARVSQQRCCQLSCWDPAKALAKFRASRDHNTNGERGNFGAGQLRQEDIFVKQQIRTAPEPGSHDLKPPESSKAS